MVTASVEPDERRPLPEHRDRVRTAGRTTGRGGPGQGRTVRLRRIGGREDDRRRGTIRVQFDVDDLACGAQPFDRAGQRELGGAEAGDEVAAPRLPALFQHFEDAVHRGVPALDAFGEDRFTRDDTVALEQLERLRVCSFGRGRYRFEERLDETPPTGAGRRPEPGQPSGTGSGRGPRATNASVRQRRHWRSATGAGPACRW